MAIRSYSKDGTKLYEIYLNATDQSGERSQIRRKGITSLRLAQTREFELKMKLSKQRENPTVTWEEWLKRCIEKMKIEYRPSTVINYDSQL
jgi:hypothetical protein